MSEACVIELEGIWARFADQIVLSDINLCVQPGEILAVIGGSGSGKTTLLREMLGLEVPSAGRACIFGLDWAQMHEKTAHQIRNRCGVLFQQGALFSALNVFDNIALPLREAHALDEYAIHDLVMLKLSLVGLAPQDAWKMPAELSGGMIRRVGLARALALDPELLFLDEPTSGLDPIVADAIVQLISSLHQQLHLTVIVVTHDVDTLVGLGGRVAVLADHHIVALGRLAEVLKVDHPFIHDYFFSKRSRRIISQLEQTG